VAAVFARYIRWSLVESEAAPSLASWVERHARDQVGLST
jgi:hypothetical protein